MRPGSVVLDLGCGAGTDLLIAAETTGPAGGVIGIDMTSSMLERAEASGRLQLADVVIHTEVSEDARARIDLWTG